MPIRFSLVLLMMTAMVVMMVSTAQDRPKETMDAMKKFLAEQMALDNKPLTDCKPNVGKNGPQDDCNSDQDCAKKYKGTKYQVCAKGIHVFTKNSCCNPNAKN